MQGDPRCPPHRWVAPSCTVIPDVRVPERPDAISRPTTFCGRCGVKWDAVHGETAPKETSPR